MPALNSFAILCSCMANATVYLAASDVKSLVSDLASA